MRQKARRYVIASMVAGALCSCQKPVDRSEMEALKATHDIALLEVSQKLEVPAGFDVELVYSVPLEEQGS